MIYQAKRFTPATWTNITPPAFSLIPNMSADPNEPKFIIPAEVHTDDRKVEVKFDAVKWFHAASPHEIAKLATEGWGRDYAADGVAEFIAAHNPDVKRVFDYLAIVNQEKTVCGFECTIDQEAAMEWLKRRTRTRSPLNPNADVLIRCKLSDNGGPEHTGVAEIVIEQDQSWASIAVWTPEGEHVGDVTVELFEGKLVARTWRKEDINGDPTTKTILCDNPNPPKT